METLSAVNRATQIREVLVNIHRIAAAGNVEVHADIIAGLPFEDYTSFGKSFSNVYRTSPQKLHLGFLKLLKGTPIRRDAEKYGYVYRNYAPYEVISNKFISAKELVRLHQVEKVLDLYYNRGGFKNTLGFLLEKFDGPFAMYEELADYYYLKGYQHANQSKENLYRIMNGFVEYKSRRLPDRDSFAEKGRELLLRDMNETLNPEAVKKFERKGWEL
ncbi:MAG: DUF4080 domain-containing protein [Firmicutes bacterium]|nr:DUF4080 domain-containing protein [Bacillota bacterium]